MSLHTELCLMGALNYKYAAPTALPGGLSGFEPFQLCQTSNFLLCSSM